MAAAKRKSIAKLCIALGLFILAGFFRQLDRVTAPLPSAACFLLTNLIYIGLAMAWGFSISRRILHRNDRRWLLLGCAMAVLWLFLRAVKYRFFSDDTITRYLWYLYYVPQILAPLFSLYAALQLGRREDDALSLKWHLLFIPAVLLIGGILINDLHQMAFRAAPDAATLEADYTHGWVYYLAMTWIIGLLLAVAIFLINNTVAIGISVRREEIGIMRLIGAKNSFIKAPFLIEGIVIGLVGAIFPLILLYFLYNKLITYVGTQFTGLSNVMDFLPAAQLFQTLLPVGMALGVGIGFFGSIVTIQRHLKV